MQNKTPDDILIRMEQNLLWGELKIIAYPVAVRSTRFSTEIKGGTFPLVIRYQVSEREEAEHDYKNLIAGKKKINELAERFANKNKMLWLLGLSDIYLDW